MDKEVIIRKTFASRDEYDEKRYIKRDDCEKALRRSKALYRFVFLTGESGCGKTWLTNHCIDESERVDINLSDALRLGGIVECIKSSIPEIEKEKKSSLKGGIKFPLASTSGETTTTFEYNHDFLWEYLEKNKNKTIIFDNFEIVIENKEILSELSCLITLADDKRMLKNNVRFLIVGALEDIMKFFQKMPNSRTIANRVGNVNLKGFKEPEIYQYVKNGFEKCGFKSTTWHELAEWICEITMGNPQSVSELCYSIAMEHYDAGVDSIDYDGEKIQKGIDSWIYERMKVDYSIIHGLYSENDEELNMVLYMISCQSMREFSAAKLQAYADEKELLLNKTIGIKKIRDYLERLSSDLEDNNILVRKKDDSYIIRNFKTKMCLKTILSWDKGKIHCLDIEECF